jgi:acyl-CoA thioesterase-1
MRSLVSRLFGPVAVAAVLFTVACSTRGEQPEPRTSPESTAPSEHALPPVAGATEPRVVVLGDSLTAGLGLPIAQAFPSQLQRRIADEGLKYTIVNAGVSGDTSAGGLSRLDWALDGDVRVLVVALGGNDALRGLPPTQLSHNLSEIIERAQTRGITVVLAGMEAPPNYGAKYALDFHRVYPALAKKYGVAFVPFLLERVAGISALNQDDGIHPTAEGAQMVADNVWAVLGPILKGEAPPNGAGKTAHQ